MTVLLPERGAVHLSETEGELIVEVERYLAAVDAFRAEGLEPRWSPEGTAPVAAVRRRRRRGLDPG